MIKFEYEAWIGAYFERMGGKVLGRCAEAAKEMQAAFPELRIVRGHVDTSWGRRGHWWLVDEKDNIVDPTAAQFAVIFEYEPWTPGDKVHAGRCMECGTDIWVAVQTIDEPPPHQSFCDDDCEETFRVSFEAEMKGYGLSS